MFFFTIQAYPIGVLQNLPNLGWQKIAIVCGLSKVDPVAQDLEFEYSGNSGKLGESGN